MAALIASPARHAFDNARALPAPSACAAISCVALENANSVPNSSPTTPVASPIAASAVSPSGATRSVSMIAIDCRRIAFAAIGQARPNTVRLVGGAAALAAAAAGAACARLRRRAARR